MLQSSYQIINSLISLLRKLVNQRALWFLKPLWLSCFLLLQHALIVFQSLVLHCWLAISLPKNTHSAWWTEQALGQWPNLISLLSHIGMIIAAEIKATWDGLPTVNMDANCGKNPSITGKEISGAETCADMIPCEVLGATLTWNILFSV